MKRVRGDSFAYPINHRPYVILCHDVMVPIAKRMQELNPDRFKYLPISWGKYPDGTDNIKIAGFSPRNLIANQHCLFLSSFHNNDVTLSQFSVLIVLLQSFIESMTVVLPYFPVGTMERVEHEGQVATANTYSMMFSHLPLCARPARLMVYDIHTLQNRFYFHSNCVPSLHTTMPLLRAIVQEKGEYTIAFPDDGAAKRFSAFFTGYDVIVCGKVRSLEARVVTITKGTAVDKKVVIVDDLVQTGGTLYECGRALMSGGATEVSAFVPHAVFPNRAWERFLTGGDRGIFKDFWVTNSVPTTTEHIPADNVFTVLDITEQIVKDLDGFYH